MKRDVIIFKLTCAISSVTFCSGLQDVTDYKINALHTCQFISAGFIAKIAIISKNIERGINTNRESKTAITTSFLEKVLPVLESGRVTGEGTLASMGVSTPTDIGTCSPCELFGSGMFVRAGAAFVMVCKC